MDLANLNKHIDFISKELAISSRQVSNTIQLLDEGSTMPFISRYRKEQTGNLDEVQITSIRDLSIKYTELDKRKETVLSTIEEQGKLTDELKKRINDCYDPTELEDIYLPYKPKRRTKATIAKEKGLEPLAELIMRQQDRDIYGKAEKFINDQVADADEALQGARDIIAEWVNEDEKARNVARRHFKRSAIIKSKVVKNKETEGIKYSDYFAFEEEVKRCASHRFLAMRRGQDEGVSHGKRRIDAEPCRRDDRGARELNDLTLLHEGERLERQTLATVAQDTLEDLVDSDDGDDQ